MIDIEKIKEEIREALTEVLRPYGIELDPDIPIEKETHTTRTRQGGGDVISRNPMREAFVITFTIRVPLP